MMRTPFSSDLIDNQTLQPMALRGQLLRLSTLIRLRWLAIGGQSLAVVVVSGLFDFPLPVLLCVSLIAASALLNIILAVKFPANTRLEPFYVAWFLGFDLIQLAGLLFLTGGLENPFGMLIIVPVVIAAGALPLRYTIKLGFMGSALVIALSVFHLPLPWYEGANLTMPPIFIAGIASAILSTMLFATLYSWRVAREAWDLADALTATELVLQREQHLTALDGLAAAAAHELGTPLATIALVAREMDKSMGEDNPLKDDVKLLQSQATRCREILTRLTSLSAEGEVHMSRMPLTSVLEDAAAPYREFEVDIVLEEGLCEGEQPIGPRRPGVLYGIGNLIENAVDFAKTRVILNYGWTKDTVTLRISDDGPGFSPNVLARIGEPYTTERLARSHHDNDKRNGELAGGLGLGLFIAKTLLERSGAELGFINGHSAQEGAIVTISWKRDEYEDRPVQQLAQNSAATP